jgi:RNA polymerase sigma-70 factor (ECF subfamily)
MTRIERWTDERLLSATRGGEAEAFGVFFSRHAQAVLVFVRRRCGSAELAGEVTAETFAAALLAVHRGRAAHVREGAPWLLGIARHKLIDSFRAAEVQDAARHELELGPIAVEDGELARIDRLAGLEGPLREALGELSVQERDALVKRVLLDRTYEEIAAETHSSPAVIRKRVSRGLARIRHTIGETP